MSENCQCHVTINNRCSVPLKVQSAKTDWGKWFGVGEPKEIAAKKTVQAFGAAGRQSSAAGCDGTVIYQLGDNPNDWVKIYYSVPLGTGKKCEFRVEESHDDIVAGVEGFNPDAWILNIMLKVVDAR